MEGLFRLLPDKLVAVLKTRLFIDKLYEVRVNNGAPVRVCYDGSYYYLCESGITKDRSAAFIAEAGEAERIVMRACDHSLYTVTETLKRGYVSVEGGIRIGVCGSGVTVGGNIAAIKDFVSVNIRVPHEIKGCASTLFAKVTVGGGIKNTLIVSPPGAGKTTVLRDLCRLLSERGCCVLLCDEKFEIASCISGAPTLDVGICTDIISGIDKSHVFEMGVAYMRPDVIIADELFTSDIESVERASTCGISVISTVHAHSVRDLSLKPQFKRAMDNRVWDLYAVLSGAPNRTTTVFEGVIA